jgi:hypothetical protein
MKKKSGTRHFTGFAWVHFSLKPLKAIYLWFKLFRIYGVVEMLQSTPCILAVDGFITEELSLSSNLPTHHII